MRSIKGNCSILSWVFATVLRIKNALERRWISICPSGTKSGKLNIEFYEAPDGNLLAMLKLCISFLNAPPRSFQLNNRIIYNTRHTFYIIKQICPPSHTRTLTNRIERVRSKSPHRHLRVISTDTPIKKTKLTIHAQKPAGSVCDEQKVRIFMYYKSRTHAAF